MTIEAIDATDGLNLEEWLKSDGAKTLQRDLEERIMQMLFSMDPSEPEFQLMVERLAWIGSTDKPLLAREIAQLRISHEIEPCGLKKMWKGACKVARFIADHKTEILVGAALCATGFGLAAVTGYSTTVVVGGIAVAGAGSILEEKNKPNPHIPRSLPPLSKGDLARLQQPLTPMPKLELPSSVDELLVTTDGIWANGHFYSNSDLMQHSLFAEELPKYTAAYGNYFALSPDLTAPLFPTTENPSPPKPASPSGLTNTFGHAAEAPQFPHPFRPEEQPLISGAFILPGKPSHARIGWINGINNTFTQSKNSGMYLQDLAGGHTISGIYNCTHTAATDLLESALLNHNGYSPITAPLLRKQWQAFHEANADRPNLKFLQVCHSQGAIHVKNALENLAPEIQDRIMVIAVAPGAVVPKRLCFRSFNYASEKDIVYKFEPPPPRPVESVTIDDVLIPTFGEADDRDRAELILLPPHPDATGIDHDFQSPTFLDRLQKRLEDYDKHNGEYLPEEKGKPE